MARERRLAAATRRGLLLRARCCGPAGAACPGLPRGPAPFCINPVQPICQLYQSSHQADVSRAAHFVWYMNCSHPFPCLRLDRHGRRAPVARCAPGLHWGVGAPRGSRAAPLAARARRGPSRGPALRACRRAAAGASVRVTGPISIPCRPRALGAQNAAPSPHAKARANPAPSTHHVQVTTTAASASPSTCALHRSQLPFVTSSIWCVAQPTGRRIPRRLGGARCGLAERDGAQRATSATRAHRWSVSRCCCVHQ